MSGDPSLVAEPQNYRSSLSFPRHRHDHQPIVVEIRQLGDLHSGQALHHDVYQVAVGCDHGAAAGRQRLEVRDERIKLLRLTPPQPGRTIGLVWRQTSPRKADFIALGQLVTEALGLALKSAQRLRHKA